MKGLGKVFYAPIDAVLDDDQVLQPDVVFIRGENQDIIGKNAIQGAPVLVVEIDYNNQAFTDLIIKAKTDEKSGKK